MSGYIYGLRRRDSFEYRYIGLTSGSVEARFKSHLVRANDLSIKYPVYDWLRKHRLSVVCDIIEIVDGDDDLLDFKEYFWIATLREQFTAGLKKKNLLNVSDGGRVYRGWKHTDEWKKNASDRLSGEGNPMYGVRGKDAPCFGRTGEKHPMFGKHHSAETVAKMSASTRGRPKSEETRERMRQGQHVRFHVNREIVKKECAYCQTLE